MCQIVTSERPLLLLLSADGLTATLDKALEKVRGFFSRGSLRGVFAFKGNIRGTFNDIRTKIYTTYNITALSLIIVKDIFLMSKRINESNS